MEKTYTELERMINSVDAAMNYGFIDGADLGFLEGVAMTIEAAMITVDRAICFAAGETKNLMNRIASRTWKSKTAKAHEAYDMAIKRCHWMK